MIVEMKDTCHGRFVKGLPRMEYLRRLAIHLQQSRALEDIPHNRTGMRMQRGLLTGRKAYLVHLDARECADAQLCS